MLTALPINEDQIRRFPLPLAQLYRRAHNAKTPQDRHLAGYYLWEAALKLLGSAAIVAYAELNDPEPELAGRLHNLARPALGHWWEFVRRLVPILADKGDPGFVTVRDLVLGPSRDDLPYVSGLDAVLSEVLDGRAGARTIVRLTELFDRLVRYRNRELGHGATGQKPAAFYDKVGRALLAGVPELLGRLDVLAGRRLVYVADVRRQPSGRWLVERYELRGENARRLESLDLPEGEAARRLLPEQVYLEGQAVIALHPLMVYDPESAEALFVNSRRGRQRIEYLSYTTGRVVELADTGKEKRELLARVLNVPVDEPSVADWAAQSQAEENVDGLTVDEPAAPRRLGEFELLSELGRGGMGVVYRAWQPSLGRQVAVKALFRTGDPNAEARFAREIRALGHVEHPHLVKIFTSGSEAEQWFYAMELVEGATLAAVCEKLQGHSTHPETVDWQTWQEAVSSVSAEARKAEKALSDPALTRSAVRNAPIAAGTGMEAAPTPVRFGKSYVRQVVELVKQAAEAAHALHERGILHRDIKPGNLMVTVDGHQAVLMDLGLAQIADEIEGRLTKTRQFVGTLRYASPEQVLAVGGLDRCSDVYNLGATLWELVTLRPMFNANEQTPTPELMRRIQVEDPEPPRRYHPGLSRDLEAIVLKCLEKDTGRRYASALDLVQDLERYQAGEPVKARTIGKLQRGWRWCRRNPVVAGLLAATALSLIVGAAGATYFAIQATARAEAEAKAKKAATLARDEALQRKVKAEWLAYTGQLALAQREWQDGNVGHARELLDECQWDLRGWEHDYLFTLFNASQQTLVGHGNTVNCVCYSPDGTQLASASWDQTVRVWDAHSGRQLHNLKGHVGIVWSVAFSPDGTRLASASRDQTIKLWDARSGQLIQTFKGHTGPVRCVRFNHNGTRLASGSEDQSVRVWDAGTGQLMDDYQGHTDAVNCVCFNPDGTLLASASEDKTVKIWRGGADQQPFTFKEHTGAVNSVAFGPDGTRVASAASDQTVMVWDMDPSRKTRLLTLKAHNASVDSICFSPDGTRLASGSEDQSIKMWDAQSGREIFTVKGHTDAVTHVCFSPDGANLASASWDKTIRLWNARAGQEIPTLDGHTGPVRGVCFSPDGRRLASASWDQTVRIWNTEAAAEPLTLQGHTNSVTSVGFSPDGARLASGSWDQTIKLWDVRSGREAQSLKGHTDAVTSVCFSPDGTRLASASWDRTIRLWDAGTGREIRTIKGHSHSVECVCFHPDGTLLASASEDRTVKIWDVESGEEMQTLSGHADPVRSVCFSPDGTRLASASDDGTVKVWDAQSGGVQLTLKGYTTSVECVCFSPDGTRLASASVNQTVKIWDAQTGQEILTLRGHANVVVGVAFSPDGTRLATASRDKSVKIWDAHAGQETLVLKGHVNAVSGVRFSADGKHIVSRARQPDDSDEIRSWELPSGAALPSGIDSPPPPDAGRTDHSPDGNFMATARGNVVVVRRLSAARSNAADAHAEGGDSVLLRGSTDAQKVEGKYSCSGTNPDGAKYGGITVEIRKRGDDYYLTWAGNAVNDEGQGTIVGAELVVTFKGTSGRGMVTYKIEKDGLLVGSWKPKGSRKEGEEILVRK